MYEYVALFWKGCHPPSDEAFITERGGLLDLGWEEVVRASWHRRPPYGGACIMRRPKDKPQKYFHTRHCLCDECEKKRDEPRKWTEAEIQEIVRTTPVVTYASE